MKLSIILPVYNPILTFLSNALQSIVKQNFDDYEVIMVIDGDTSALQDIKPFADKLPLKVVTVNLEKHGAGNSRNIGLSVAQGDWITFIDQDDELEDNAFKQVFDIIEQQKLKYICCTLLYEYDASTEQSTYHTDKQDNIDVWLHGKYYNRKNLLNKYRIRFKKNLRYLEDLYFNNKVIQTLYKLREIDNPTFRYYNVITYKWIAYPFATHNSLIEDKYNFNHYGLSYHYCDVVFPFLLDLVPDCKTEEARRNIQHILLCDLAYLYVNYNIIVHTYGQNDKLPKVLLKKVHKYIADIINICTLSDPCTEVKNTIEYIVNKDIDIEHKDEIMAIPFRTWWMYALTGKKF